MINGFEQQTEALTEREMQLIPVMCKCLQAHLGKDNAVTSTRMIQGFANMGFKVTGSRIRKMINHIRHNNLVPCLISANNGYYIATSHIELADYVRGLMSRANEINAVADVLRTQGAQRWGGTQQALWG